MQTELYIPPPVENGIIPKNNFGNIDIYTPSMIPEGGAHIIRSSISIAAQFAGIDYADAVTGFDFVRNKASARVNGIIVAKENVEGLLTVWEGMMERVEEEEERRRVVGVLERWRRFIVGLGIRRRLDETHGKLDEEDTMVVDERDEDFGGGFLLGAVQDGQGFGTNFNDEARGDMEDVHYERQETLSDEGLVEEKASDIPLAVNKSEPLEDDRDDQQRLDHKVTEVVEDAVVPKDDSGDEFQMGDVESEGGGFIPENSDSDGGGFIYDDEDGIL
jgi:xeroderma pigmentosum group C-complementing protein